MTLVRTIFLLFTVAIATSVPGQEPQHLVAPPESAETEGPFGRFFLNGDDTRLQAVYSARSFLSNMPDGGVITGMAYRLDTQSARSIDANVELEVWLSTTQSVPSDRLSHVYQDKIGPDYTKVLSRRAVRLTAMLNEGSLQPFLVKIPFDDRFFTTRTMETCSLIFLCTTHFEDGWTLIHRSLREVSFRPVTLAASEGAGSPGYP